MPLDLRVILGGGWTQGLPSFWETQALKEKAQEEGHPEAAAAASYSKGNRVEVNSFYEDSLGVATHCHLGHRQFSGRLSWIAKKNLSLTIS